MSINLGSKCPIVFVESAVLTLGDTVDGPGPNKRVLLILDNLLIF